MLKINSVSYPEDNSHQEQRGKKQAYLVCTFEFDDANKLWDKATCSKRSTDKT